MINIVRLIRDFLKLNKISIIEFADIINCSRATAYRILSCESIHIGVLYMISKKFGHDFFYDISKKVSQEIEGKKAFEQQ
jgi:transcriptional regulator with XRE-family HTH domain